MTLIPFPHAEGVAPIFGIGLRANAAAGALELVLGDLREPDDARVLVAFGVDREAERADHAWREERTADGRVVWRDEATDAAIACRRAEAGAVRLTLDAGRASSWILGRGETGPLMGPAGRVPINRRRWPLDALNPSLSEAVAASGGFAARDPAHLACEAFAMSLAPRDGGALLFQPARSGAGAPDRVAFRPSRGGAIDLLLVVKFEASSRAFTGIRERPNAGEERDSEPPVRPGLAFRYDFGTSWAIRTRHTQELTEWVGVAVEEGVPGGRIARTGGLTPEINSHALSILGQGYALGDAVPSGTGDTAGRVAAIALAGMSDELGESVLSSRSLRPLTRRRGTSPGATLEALAFGAFVPHFQFELDVDDEGRLRSPWWQGKENELTAWKRAAAMRLAFLPYHAHLLCRAVREGLPIARPAGVHPIDMTDQPRPWQPHLMLGDDVFVAAPPTPDADGTRRVHLPGGEWVDFYRGGRYRGARELKPDDYGPGEVPAFVRAGAVLPLLDLSTEVPWAGYYCKRRGPGDRLILKLAPTEGHETALYDVLALTGESAFFAVPRVPMLRVAHQRRGPVLELRIEGKARPLTLLLRTFKPGRVAAGPTAKEAAPLAVMSSEKQFAAADDCWYYHPHRDETLIKTRVDAGGALVVRIEEMHEFGEEG